MEMTEEQWKRRQEGIANLPPRIKEEPVEEQEEDDDEPTWQSPLRPETVQAQSTGTAPERQPRQLHQEKASNQELSIGQGNSQPAKLIALRKVRKGGIELTDECPFFYINKPLANCRIINWTEKALVGILNFFAGRWEFASISFEQLAHYLGLAPGTVENLVSKLEKLEFIQDQGRYPNGKHRIAVGLKWRNPKKKRTKPSDEIPF
jgi:hypothetical protein